MAIRFKCQCGKRLRVSEQAAGKTGKCPFCGQKVQVPAAPSAPWCGDEQPPTPVPIPAPMATEVPHPPFHTAEARSAATWKCPTCAEEIQKEAQKCRFCGMILTKAAKMGYPAFYENVAENGLTFTSLLFDYADYLYHDEGGVEDCCLSAPNMLGNLFDSPGQKTEVLKKAGGIVKAMRERLSDIPAESQEALTLRATCQLLWMVRDFALPRNPGTGVDPIGDPHTLEFAISHFTKLRQSLAPIESEGRQELEQHIDYAIRACQNQLGTTGGFCGESHSPAASELQSQAVPSSAGGDLGGLSKELTLDLGSGSGLGGILGSRVKMELVLIPPGRFVMGSPLDEEGRNELECSPVYVTISQPYYLGKYQVTQEQYEKIMGCNFSDTKGAHNPADRISWNDADEFCRKLSVITGQMVRLPTEAEWEYACRAGTTTRFCSGDSESDLTRVGWYAGNSGQRTHPVGKKAPNAWGLYDMHGNVYEWCRDWSDNPTERSGPLVDPQGPEYGSVHPLRGGCWGDSANGCRSAAGMEGPPDVRNNTAGFRVVVDPWRRELISQKTLDSESADEQKLTEGEVPGGEQSQASGGVSCYYHGGRAVVASCSQGCGRWLCQECAARYEPPACSECANKALYDQRRALAQTQSRIIIRMAVNTFVMISYIVGMVLLSRGVGEPGKPGATPALPCFMLLLILVWGFFGFRWLLNALSSLTGMMFFAGIRTWGVVFFVGSVLVGAFMPIVVPFLILADVIRLVRGRSTK